MKRILAGIDFGFGFAIGVVLAGLVVSGVVLGLVFVGGVLLRGAP